MNKAGLIAATFLSVFFAILFAIFGGLRTGFALENLAVFGAAGAILGLIGAPEVAPKAFRYPTLWQIFVSVAGCLLFAACLDAPTEGYMLAVVGGIVIGYLAPNWIKHIQAP